MLLDILQKVFELYKTRHICHHRHYKNVVEKLKKSFLQKVRRPPDHREAINIKNRFINGGQKRYFLFLEREGVSPTNNATEQAIRFVVIDRRVTQSTRSWLACVGVREPGRLQPHAPDITAASTNSLSMQLLQPMPTYHTPNSPPQNCEALCSAGEHLQLY